MQNTKDIYTTKLLKKNFSHYNLIFLQLNKLNAFEMFLLKKELFKRNMIIFSIKNKKVINIFKNSKFEPILKQVLTGPTHIIGFPKKTPVIKDNFLFLKQLNILAIIYHNNILYKQDFNFILDKASLVNENYTKIKNIREIKQSIAGNLQNILKTPAQIFTKKNQVFSPIVKLNSKIYSLTQKP